MNNTQVQKQDTRDREIEIVPFGATATEKIKLSIRIVQSLLCKPTKSGAVCSNQDAMRFIMMCKARRCNPFEGDAFLVGYDGQNGPEFSIITAHQIFLKRAELHPEFDGFESGVIVEPGTPCKPCGGAGIIAGSICGLCYGSGTRDEVAGDIIPKDQRLVGGWCRVHFRNRRVAMHKRVPIKTFDKGNKFWRDNPGGMITKCAEADALRASFPSMLGGMRTTEEGGEDFGSMGAVDIGSTLVSETPPEATVQPKRQLKADDQQDDGGLPDPAGHEDPTDELSTDHQKLADFLDAQGVTFDDLLAIMEREQLADVANITDLASMDGGLVRRLNRMQKHLAAGFKPQQ